MNRFLTLSSLTRTMLIVFSGLALMLTTGCDKEKQDSIRLYNSGLDELEGGRFDAAYSAFARASRIDPQNALALMEMAIIDVDQRKEIAKGLELIKKAAEVAPNDRDVTFQAGRLEVLHGDIQTGLNFLQQTLKLDPNHAPSWYYTGLAQLKSGNLDDADNALREALAIDPEHEARAFFELGTLYEKALAFEAARQVYEEGLRHNPSDSDLLNAAGLLALDEGRVDDAVELLQKASASGGTRVDVLFSLASAYMQANKTSKAIAYFQNFINAPGASKYPEQLKLADQLRTRLLAKLESEKEQ